MKIQISSETELRILFSELFKLSPEHNLDDIFPSLAGCTRHMMDRNMISHSGMRRALEIFLYFHQIDMSKEIASSIESKHGDKSSLGMTDIISILNSDEKDDTKSVKALYCLKSHNYEEKIPQINHASRSYLENLNLTDLECVLDLACGTGLAGPVMRNAGFTGRLVGVDISPHMLWHAEGKNCYDQLVEKNILNFIKDCEEVFDLVFMLDAAPHFTLLEMIDITKGIYGLLKHGGIFLINTAIIPENSQSVWSKFGLHRFSNISLEDAMRNGGFAFSYVDDPDRVTRRYECRKDNRPPA